MTSYLERIHRGENPFVESRTNELDREIDRLYELKFGLVFYTSYPPWSKRARAVFDLYLERYGARIRRYVPTIPGSLPQDWTATSQRLFHNQLWPALRKEPIRNKLIVASGEGGYQFQRNHRHPGTQALVDCRNWWS